MRANPITTHPIFPSLSDVVGKLISAPCSRGAAHCFIIHVEDASNTQALNVWTSREKTRDTEKKQKAKGEGRNSKTMPKVDKAPKKQINNATFIEIVVTYDGPVLSFEMCSALYSTGCGLRTLAA